MARTKQHREPKLSSELTRQELLLLLDLILKLACTAHYLYTEGVNRQGVRPTCANQFSEHFAAHTVQLISAAGLQIPTADKVSYVAMKWYGKHREEAHGETPPAVTIH